ncbi:MAG: type I CRISPR-associated protein Cas7 [Bacilli bacterium]|nr:type I CRISPR-associated protein Cas7 [Bacilli bacterium]
MANFLNRVFGCAVVKAINSNYNADFSGQPRTLPNGVVYATDKAFKYTVKNYLKCVYPLERIFYFKSLNENMNPISLDETYKKNFGDYPKTKEKKGIKIEVTKNLLNCLDVRMFGATFAGETNVSLHGPVQINHGVNIWSENHIFTEQITSPFSNKSNDPDAEKGMTTIGRQSRLEEGHYLHHFSVNPANISEMVELSNGAALSDEDICKLKEAMRRGATWYDSASKAGCENEMLVWIQLKKESKIVLPNLTTLIDMENGKEDGMVIYDFAKLKTHISALANEIEKIELYINKQACKLINKPDNVEEMDI